MTKPTRNPTNIEPEDDVELVIPELEDVIEDADDAPEVAVAVAVAHEGPDPAVLRGVNEDVIRGSEGCELCRLAREDTVTHASVWYAFGQKLSFADTCKFASKLGLETNPEALWKHLWGHVYEQPQAQGKFKPRQAMQEALASFPEHYFWILRALYRFKTLSERQIKAMFYTPYFDTKEEAETEFLRDFKRLVFRSYVFKHHVSSQEVIKYVDAGPYYFLNRQAIPALEELEKRKVGFHLYATRDEQVDAFHLEEDARVNACFVSLRTVLHGREFPVGERKLGLHLSVENTFTAKQMHWTLPLGPKGAHVRFAPQMFAAVRAEDQGSLSILLPFFFEYDRGVDDVSTIVDKIGHYFRFYRSDAYKEIFPQLAGAQHYPPIFIVSDTPYRVANIMKQLEARVGVRPLQVYFTDFETFGQNPWASSIWRAINTEPDERFTLLPRLLFHSRDLTKKRLLGGRERVQLGDFKVSVRDEVAEAAAAKIQDADADTDLENLL